MKHLSFKLLITNPIRFGYMHFMSAFVAWSKWRKKIDESGLFDPEYYRCQVSNGSKMSKSALLRHYLREGWKYGYNPSESFATESYCDQYYWHHKFSYSPLEHYLFWGYRHNCFPSAVEDKGISLCGKELETWIDWAGQQEHPVLLISHEFSNTGAPIALLWMAESMKKKGLSPLIISTARGNLQKEITSKGIDNIVVNLFPLPFLKGYEEKCWYVKRFLEPFDFVVFNCIIALCWAAKLPRINKPSICWIHDGPVAMKNAFITSNLVESVNRMSLVYGVSQFTIDTFAPHCNKDVIFRLFPYGISDIETNNTKDKEQSAEEGNCVKILMPGQISKRKGHHILVDAMMRVPEDCRRKCKIIIAGPSSEAERELRDRIVEWADANDNIEYLGELSHDSFVKLYDDVDIVLCPSLEDPLPIVCAEAMSKGKAIIVSDHTGTAGLIEDRKSGYIVKSADVNSLSEAICYAVNHPDEMKEVGLRGRKVFEDVFNIDAFDKRVGEMVDAAYELVQLSKTTK